MRWKSITYGSALALALFAVPASAAPITGILNITGAASVTATTIDWVPLGTGEGRFDITFPGTGYFTNIYLPVSGDNTGDSLDLPAGAFRGEVARLLAHGHSNRQIAAVLVISERTVHAHVYRILGKLGLSSRSQVAAWAVSNRIHD